MGDHAALKELPHIEAVRRRAIVTAMMDDLSLFYKLLLQQLLDHPVPAGSLLVGVAAVIGCLCRVAWTISKSHFKGTIKEQKAHIKKQEGDIEFMKYQLELATPTIDVTKSGLAETEAAVKHLPHSALAEKIETELSAAINGLSTASEANKAALARVSPAVSSDDPNFQTRRALGKIGARINTLRRDTGPHTLGTPSPSPAAEEELIRLIRQECELRRTLV